MEDTLKLPLHVELYGLPGCGKSTVSHKVAEMLRSEGFGVIEPSYDLDHLPNSFVRKARKLLSTFSWLIFHIRSYLSVDSIVKANGYSHFEKLMQISNVIQKLRKYQNIHSNNVVIWDQGLVQAAISLSICGEIEASENLVYLLRLIPSNVTITHFLINVGSSVAIQRMTLRSSNDSRVEKIKDIEEKLFFLQKFENGISSINENCSYNQIVDGLLTTENQAEIIFQCIKNRIQK